MRVATATLASSIGLQAPVSRPSRHPPRLLRPSRSRVLSVPRRGLPGKARPMRPAPPSSDARARERPRVLWARCNGGMGVAAAADLGVRAPGGQPGAACGAVGVGPALRSFAGCWACQCAAPRCPCELPVPTRTGGCRALLQPRSVRIRCLRRATPSACRGRADVPCASVRIRQSLSVLARGRLGPPRERLDAATAHHLPRARRLPWAHALHPSWCRAACSHRGASPRCLR